MRPVLACLAFVGLLATSGCEFACQNLERDRITSPNGEVDVVLFTRDCGTATALSSQVALVKRGEPVRNAGNVRMSEREIVIRPRWAGDTLVIAYRAAGGLRRHDKVNGLPIRYEVHSLSSPRDTAAQAGSFTVVPDSP